MRDDADAMTTDVRFSSESTNEPLAITELSVRPHVHSADSARFCLLSVLVVGFDSNLRE